MVLRSISATKDLPAQPTSVTEHPAWTTTALGLPRTPSANRTASFVRRGFKLRLVRVSHPNLDGAAGRC
jgi:hypothetical protein